MQILVQNLRKLLNLRMILSFLVLSVLCSFNVNVYAQSPYSAAYRVNSAVITHYELDQMAQLFEAIGRGQDNPSQAALDFLIDSRLLDQEAARFNIETDPILVSRALDNISQGNSEKFVSEMRAKGVARETIDEFISTQILLRTYLDLRGVKSDVAPEEITQRISQIPDQVTPTVHIAEIVIPFAEYGGRIPTRFKVNGFLDELRNGKPFSQLAREVSRSPTAANGGRLPEIPREGLNSQLKSVIRGLRPGQVAAPIEVDGAIILIQYVGNGEIRNSLPRDPQVSFVDLYVPANGNLAQSKAQAVQLSAQVKSCDRAKALNPAGYKENVSVSSLSSGVSLTLARLESGQGAVYERENGTSYLFLCTRQIAVPEQFTEAVDSMAYGEALELRSRGVMIELRNLANIAKVQ